MKESAPIFIHSALDDYGLTAPPFRVLARIARRVGTKDGLTGVFWESPPEIAKACRLDERTVRVALKQLVALKILSRQEIKSTSENGNEYTFKIEYTVNPVSKWNPSHFTPPVSPRKRHHPPPCKSTGGGGLNPPDRPPSHLAPPEGNPSEVTPIEGNPQKGEAAPIFAKSGKGGDRKLYPREIKEAIELCQEERKKITRPDIYNDAKRFRDEKDKLTAEGRRLADALDVQIAEYKAQLTGVYVPPAPRRNAEVEKPDDTEQRKANPRNAHVTNNLEEQANKIAAAVAAQQRARQDRYLTSSEKRNAVIMGSPRVADDLRALDAAGDDLPPGV